ncbi:TLR4 interactor with leucine rich repeats [Habropoda laboriosa]|uniref:TLR4 interactor with leucine rich repeats n=1 Tax=Habropoda laboriosa TaxID=597456 RepID=A0A0L7QTK3_9HYME|nr:PREDICTED: chaoptin-like [Habropoda laboriosa]KOC61987.1 TLR4 interactor with leucine rich repeats [Habropoda laboriosa]
MKLSFVLGVALVLSPLIVLAKFLPPEIISFEKVCENETLKFKRNDLIDFNEIEIISDSIECVVIRASMVQNANRNFDRLPNLKYLDVDLYSDSLGLNSLGNLTTVRALKFRNTGNYDVRVVEVQNEYPNLKYLDLSSNQIEKITSDVKNPFPEVRYLNLSWNYLNSLEFNYIFSNLSHLDLSGNTFNEFHWNLGRQNLSSLVLDSNQMTAIGSFYYPTVDLTDFYNLVNLSIADNKIHTILQDAFASTPNLRRLDLSRNSIKSLNSSTFQYLSNLEVLLLDGNLLSLIPEISANISTLSLNCNNITTVTRNSLLNLKTLRKLYLEGDNITYIDVDAFQNQILLEELYLGGNRLNFLPRLWCANMTNLRYLDLSWNKFTLLEAVTYSPNFPVNEINMEGNPLTFVHSSTFESMPKNVTISLNIGSEQLPRLCNRPV